MTQTTVLTEYLVGVIGLWTAFVIGVSVGLWLGVTWWRRMNKWAGEVVEANEASSVDGHRGGSDPRGGTDWDACLAQDGVLAGRASSHAVHPRGVN